MTSKPVEKPKVLVACGSTEGQTFRIARFLLPVIREAGFTPNLADASDLYRNVHRHDYAAIIVGASVHHGEHQASAINFVKDTNFMNDIPSAFFSVSLNAALHDDMHQQETKRYVDDFLEATSWRPSRTLRVAGALRNTQLDYFRRELARHIVAPNMVKADETDDFDFTDYDDVAQFVREFLDEVVKPSLESEVAR